MNIEQLDKAISMTQSRVANGSGIIHLFERLGHRNDWFMKGMREEQTVDKRLLAMLIGIRSSMLKENKK